LPDPILYETDAGFIVVQGDDVIVAERSEEDQEREAKLAKVAEGVKRRGISRLKVSSMPAKEKMEEMGIEVSIITDDERDELDSRRFAIMAKAGLASDAGSALETARARAIATAEQKVSEASSKEDLHLVNAIQALDDLDKFLNITTERTMEWYSLHFPELQDILKDNVALAKLVIEIGRRGTFDKDALERQGFGDKKSEAITMASAKSKGGTISEKDMRRIIGLAELSIKTASEREKLAEYVESTMTKIAPNVTQVAGATIGARLIARAGGLERMARLPASTIQVLGAEKALFRALRTGARPPKHGILFQHEAVHMAPKWQRGKIARTIANKIAIAARIDFYRGEKAGELTGQLEKRLAEIKIKYASAPEKWQSREREQNYRPARRLDKDTFRGRRDHKPGKGRPRTREQRQSYRKT
jgi:nucleolar protein 56